MFRIYWEISYMLLKSKRKALLSSLVNGSFLEKMKADNRAKFGTNNNWEEHVTCYSVFTKNFTLNLLRQKVLSAKLYKGQTKFALKIWILICIIIIVIIFIIIIIELKHSKTILGNTVEIEPQLVALDFINLSQYSSRSK